MANVEISDLVNKATPLSTDEFEIQATIGGLSNKVTLANIALNFPQQGNIGVGVAPSATSAVDARRDGLGSKDVRVALGADVSSVSNFLATDSVVFITNASAGDCGIQMRANASDWGIRNEDSGSLKFEDETTLRLEINGSGNFNFQAGNLTTTGTVTCAAFTSTGIDDNATGERLQIGDGTIILGTAGSTYVLSHVATDQLLQVSGGSSGNLGSNIVMHSESHATLANDFKIRTGSTDWFHYDDSAGSLDFHTVDLVTTGDAAVAGLTLTGLVKKSVTDAITAGATQTQAGATALTTDINRVTVVATASDGVKLPTAVAGLEILIVNDDSTDALQVWPNTSDTIDGGAADAVDSNTLAAGAARRYISVDATNWFTA